MDGSTHEAADNESVSGKRTKLANARSKQKLVHKAITNGLAFYKKRAIQAAIEAIRSIGRSLDLGTPKKVGRRTAKKLRKSRKGIAAKVQASTGKISVEKESFC